MVDPELQWVLEKVQSIINEKYPIRTCKSPEHFPYPEIYQEQIEPVKIVQNLKPGESCLLCSHTGSGKTAVYLSCAYDTPTLIIEPRRYLQEQVNEDYPAVKTTVIMGKVNYPCRCASNADVAPCKKKYSRLIDGKYIKFFKEFISEREWIETEYPCPGCQYAAAKSAAKRALENKGIVICNSGNFMEYLQYANTIILDEADLTCQDISSSKKLKFVDDLEENVRNTLQYELNVSETRMEEISKRIDAARSKTEQEYWLKEHDILEKHLRGVQEFSNNSDICFQYKKETEKHGNKHAIYVEIRPDNITELVRRYFAPVVKGHDIIPDKLRRVVFVTATPGDFPDNNKITYIVPQRAGIFYTPVERMTRQKVNVTPDAIKRCGEYIKKIHEMFKTNVLLDDEYNLSKCIVHTGNLDYANELADILGRDLCEVHKAGELKEALERFETNDKEYLLVASADYGGDFKTISHQFILKLPYPTLDNRLQAFRHQVGDAYFNTWFARFALSRLIQESGRVGRGANGVGFTFILDSAFRNVYADNYDTIVPDWFKLRVERVKQVPHPKLRGCRVL